MESSSIYNEETHTKTADVPACCLTCGNYQPKFFKVAHKECAAFGTIKGVKWDRCGAWTKRIV